MTLPTDRILAFLAISEETHTIGDIVLQMAMERTEVERTLNELASAGHVHRSEGVDGHPPRYRITQLGRLLHIQRVARSSEGEE